VLEPYTGNDWEAPFSTSCTVRLEDGTWPNNQVEKLPDQHQWRQQAPPPAGAERNLLIFWVHSPQGRACIGYSRRLFEPY
jgi:hypothetical protein